MFRLLCSFAFAGILLFGAANLSIAQRLDSMQDDSGEGSVGSDGLVGNSQAEDVNNEGNPTESDGESKRLSRSIGAIKDHGKIKIGTFQSIHCEGLLKHNGRKIRGATNYSPELGLFTQLKCSGLENYLSSNIKPFKGFDCLAIQKHYGERHLSSGVYTIYPKGDKGVDVYCDMERDKGGWTVIQRRFNGRENFQRNWKEYKNGFGKKSQEYWLGNDNIHRLTSNDTCQLRIDMEDSKKKVKHAIKYRAFKISDENGKYKLTIGAKLSGNVTFDGMAYHNGRPFSTKDKDNDSWGKNCAATYTGAWWYGSCHHSNLNGVYYSGHSTSDRYNTWYQLVQSGQHINVRSSTMMIKCKQ